MQICIHTYVHICIDIYRSNVHIYISARMNSSERKANILAGVRRARHGVAMLGVYVCVWQCVAVCCSVLLYVVVCCSVLLYVVVCCSVLQCVAVCCSVL